MPQRKDPGPSVKDPELYEALRDDGASKEKAARIAKRGGQHLPLVRRPEGGILGRLRGLDEKGPDAAGQGDRDPRPIDDDQGSAHRGPANALNC